MPSRSIRLIPLAATSNKISTRASFSKLTSSTYKTPSCAFANNPSLKLTCFSFSTRCKSSVPKTRSSLAPSGKFTKAASLFEVGKISDRPRASVDLALPRGPLINTPPIAGFMATRIKAFLNSTWPVTALNGNC